jgi:adenylate cyclase
VERRLAAILAADVVGYSKLMTEDEEATLSQLKEHRAELFNPKIADHNGRIIKLMGDGTLVEFVSVVDAVEAALVIQRALSEGNGPIKLRIGINLGDVIVDGDDIYGDGVNIASRLEALAAPGGICISSIVHESLGHRLEAEFADAGEREVKNIARPIHVYSWPQSLAASSRKALKPTIAILAFDNLSGDPEQAYFADGITEDIITELSRYGEFMVIARNSSYAFKGKLLNARQVGKELGAGYIVEGSVRRGGDRVRVTAQLIDCATDGHLWAERFDRNLTDIFAVQDEITHAIVAALGSVVQSSEAKRAMRNLPSNMAAYDHFLRSWEFILQMKPEAILTGKRIAEEAIQLDPNYARPYCTLAMFHTSMTSNGWSDDFTASLDQARKAARQAVTIDPQDPWAHSFLGLTELWHRNYDSALAETTRAIELNPSFADGYVWLANVEGFAGAEQRGLDRIAIARSLNPLAPVWYSTIEARGHFGRQDYAEALRMANDALIHVPHLTSALAIAVVSCAALGKDRDAHCFANTMPPAHTQFQTVHC